VNGPVTDTNRRPILSASRIKSQQVLLPALGRGSARGGRIFAATTVYTLLAMPGAILLDNAFSLREVLRGVVPQWVSQGLVPGLILVLLVILPLLVLLRLRAGGDELILALFTIMLVSATVFTLSGFFFRGPGFKLYLPWQMPGGYNPLDGL